MGRLALVVLTLLVATPAAAREIRFPLTVDYETLRGALRRHLHETSGGELTLWRTPDGCGSFVLREPTVEPAEGRLRISGRGEARAGLYVLGWCLASVSWDGHAEILARPELGQDWQLRFRDLDLQLLDASRQRTGIANRVFLLVKGWAESELSTFTFDLGPPVQELRLLLGAFAGSDPTRPLASALRTLRPVFGAVEQDALKAVVAIDVPPAAPQARAPEPAPTPAELQRWREGLERWDGFLTFVVRELGDATGDPAARNELLDLLLAARHEWLVVLGRGPEPEMDPVRALFLSTWERLRTVVRRAAAQKGVESRALRYLVFLAAGDALTAIDAAAPGAGFEISTDGLRRLARALDPAHPTDPLEYSDLPDPKLQQIFRLRDPDAPPRRPRRKSPSGWRWLAPRPAFAVTGPEEWSLLATRLDRWVPTDADLASYRATVDRLLTVAAERSLDPDALDEQFDDVFYHLVKSVAWQESCWRQFVKREGRVIYISSQTGDVGMMQINVRVWRGFFSPDKLRWNAAYNVGAGAEILQQLLIRYGVREARERRLEDAARATYAAYNGGPARHRRYRLPNVPPAIRTVDRAFWEKYQAVAAGRADERVLCLVPSARPS